MPNHPTDPLAQAGLAAVPMKPDVDMLGAALRAGAETPALADAVWVAMLAALDEPGPLRVRR